ncbi:G8 domain-containing protein [Caldimonas brevitalea]|uniref:Copper binding protein, plastocyanin/azurin family n=1 Tax=Caldimonas brevitalea TaxID=413882 RepID=A0A0G3BUT1_9BURK|nr:G8 domain-containing protein [Caldimonas brevitalea]AKJ31141.1 copper binding protein, plastocyanin/azurin family [Caldimonas brevitalea]
MIPADAPRQLSPVAAARAAIFVATLLLASCGGGDEKSSGAPAGAPESASQPEPERRPAVEDHALAWSQPSTWGGQLPTAGVEVVIPAGKIITLDTDTPPLAGLRIEGTLRFARRNVALTAGYIDVTGALEIGTADEPYTQQAVITLTGAPRTPNDGVSRGLNVRGGRLEIHGAAPQPVWTRLAAHATAGTTSLQLNDTTTGWRAGDRVAIAPTDFYGATATERLTLSAAGGTQLTLSTPLAKFRWGRLQYVTDHGMSLTEDPSFVPPASPAPTVLDERAAVGNLSRNIVLQAPDDEAWRNSGFGVHVMIMNLASKVVVDGVEIRRAGQAGVVGRYPFHWHMLSYDEQGQLRGDAAGHVIRNSSVWDSSQRCIVVHGTNGVQVLHNICHDIAGHAFFLEDAVERRNVFEGNLALKMRAPPPERRLQVHEGEIHEAGPSGFWLTNPDNIVRHNLAGDTAGNGFWLAFPPKPLGLSARVPLRPDRMAHGVFEHNTGHSARASGILLEHVPIDAAGNTVGNYYIPTADGTDGGPRLKFTLKRITSYKNNGGAYRNRAVNPQYVEWVTADNVGTHFAGAVQVGELTRALVIGTSLNQQTLPPSDEPPVAFASYHSALDMHHNTVVSFPFVAGKSSGVFKTDDYYLMGVDKGPVRNANNRLIQSSPGYRTLPPHMDGQPLNRRHWTFAGALWDPHGYWGPKGNYWVYDVPFLTSGAQCAAAAPAGQNGRSCDGEYYGVQSYKTDFDPSDYSFTSPVEVTRQDATGNTIGTWSVADGTVSTMLGHMRHFAARNGGRYVLRFPGRPLPRSIELSITNVYRSSDAFILAVSFDGSLDATGYLTSWHNRAEPKSWSPDTRPDHVRRFTPANSYAEVLNGNGNLVWQDRANHLVWVKVQGGLTPQTGPVNSDQDLYRTYGLLLYPR